MKLKAKVADPNAQLNFEQLQQEITALRAEMVTSATMLAAVAAHEADNSAVHGIADTTLLTKGVEGLRLLRGSVTAAGAIQEGSGFTVTKNPGSGDYTINFSAAFADAPSWVATPDGNLVDDRVSETVNNFRVQFRDPATATLTDAFFHFIAVGP